MKLTDREQTNKNLAELDKLHEESMAALDRIDAYLDTLGKDEQ